MRIVCPTCQAAYDVPAPVIEAGRTLRCARCAADFLPSVPAPEPQGYVSLAPPIETQETLVTKPMLARQSAPPRRDTTGILVMAWLLSFAVLGAAGWAFVAYRGPIVQAWPASARVYAALGYRI